MDSVLMMRDCAGTVDFDNQRFILNTVVSFRDLSFIKSRMGGGVYFI